MFVIEYTGWILFGDWAAVDIVEPGRIRELEVMFCGEESVWETAPFCRKWEGLRV